MAMFSHCLVAVGLRRGRANAKLPTLPTSFGQLLLLQETSNKLEQENKFMAEALEDLQDSTSRLEAENRTLKMGSPLKGRAGSASSGKVRDD